MKKRGFGMNRWNGMGGKVQPGEGIEEAAIRETQEESHALPQTLSKVAEIVFLFPHHPDWDQRMHVYCCESWQREVSESEEMKPEWFPIHAIPYDTMWPDDTYWLPEVLAGKRVSAQFTFGENDVVLHHAVEIVPDFPPA